ncbi:MAG: cytochrome c biogenesis protein CcdA [Bacteroidales bacterium]
MFKKELTFLVILFFGASLFSNLSAQVLEPVSWSFSHKEKGENVYELEFKAVIEQNWAIYGPDIPAGGPIATSIEFNKSDDYKLIDGLVSPDVDVKYDPNFEMELAMISGQATFTQLVKVISDEEVIITGELVYMSCDDSRCLPPDYIDFEFKLPAAKAVEKQEAATKAEIEPLIEIDDTTATIDIEEEVKAEETEEKSIQQQEELSEDKEESSLFWDLIKGFLGGLLALLTPCVFPMIPLTVSYFLRNAGNRRKAVRDALFYGFSIVFSYVVLGMAISMIFGADTLNALATSPGFNVFFFLLLMFFAASFFGAFELQMPASWSNKLDSKADKTGGLAGVFLMGIVFVLVSFSCTGPIVGTLLVEAATGGSLFSPAMGMLGFSLALAIPFTLFAVFPTALKSLPKSGGWMNAIKVFLGFIVVAFALKFLATADAVAQWGIVTRELFIVLWMAIFLLLGLYLIGKIKFAHDSELNYVSVPRLFLAIASFAFVFYLLPGLFGAPLKTVSSFLPSMTTQSFDLSKGVAGTAIIDQDNIYTGKSVKEGPHGLMAFTDYEEGLAAAKKAGKPVLLDFTGLGCSNCRKMEATVWSEQDVIDRFKNNFVKISLFVDDRTSLPENEQFVSSAMGRERKITRVGQKWSLFQAEKYGTNTQPYYVILDHDEQILTEPRGYNTDVEEYIKFLDEGFENFKNKK